MRIGRRRRIRTRKSAVVRASRRYVGNPTKTGSGVGHGLMGNQPMQLVIHKGLGFPVRFRTKMRYNELVSIASVGGSLSAYTFVANGLFDPNNTGTGHQPMYFDQAMLIYNHYKVIGSKINVKIAGPSNASTPTANTQIAVIVTDDNTLSGVTSFSQIVEWGQLNAFKLYGSYYSQQKNANVGGGGR